METVLSYSQYCYAFQIQDSNKSQFFFLGLSLSALRTQTLLIKIDSTNNLNTLFTLIKLEGP